MEYVWLCLSAVAAGAVNAVAGGGTLLTFSALAGVVSLDIANASSTVALFPGTCASVWGYRRQMHACRRWITWLTLPSLAGGALGASLVEEDSFRFVVPWLILSAAILLMLQPSIARLFLRRQSTALRGPSRKTLAAVIIAQLLIGIYGGYFGAGIGILMLSTLSFLSLDSIHQTNALKSVLAFWMNSVAAMVFIARGMVRWDYALAMGVAAIIGGYFGARLSLLLEPAVVRWIVIALAFGLAAYYFGKEFAVAGM